MWTPGKKAGEGGRRRCNSVDYTGAGMVADKLWAKSLCVGGARR